MLAAEGVTLLSIRGLLSWHIAIGLALIPPVGLKVGVVNAEAPVPADQPVPARRLKLPDCCVLLAAEHAGALLATFDPRLAGAAEQRGLALLNRAPGGGVAAPRVGLLSY